MATALGVAMDRRQKIAATAEAVVKGIASAEQLEQHILLQGIIGATNDLQGSTS